MSADDEDVLCSLRSFIAMMVSGPVHRVCQQTGFLIVAFNSARDVAFLIWPVGVNS